MQTVGPSILHLEKKQHLSYSHIKQRSLAFLTREGTMIPTIFAEGTLGNARFLLPDLPDTEDPQKRRYLFLRGVELAEEREHLGAVKHLFLVLLAWIGRNPFLQPVNDPLRQEALVISGINLLSKEQSAQILKIERNTQGEVHTLTTDSTIRRSVTNLSLLYFLSGYIFVLKQHKKGG